MLARALFRIRNSARAFANTPGTSLALLVSIAVGIGSSASIGGFIEGLAHPRSHLGSSGQVVSIFAHDRLSDAGPLSNREFQAIRGNTAEFSWIDAVRIAPFEVTIGGRSEILTVASVMPELAKALNLGLRGGAVLSDRLLENTDNGNGTGAGQIAIGNQKVAITGVVPKTLEGLYGDRPIDLWMPFEDGVGHDANPDHRDLWVLATLQPGVSIDAAERKIRAELRSSDHVTVVAYSGIAPATASGLASIILLLKYIASAVFLIACINVASLLLGRTLERAGETSLRVALGATRKALSAQLFSDSVVVALAGGILGLFMSLAAKRVIPNLLFQGDAERLIFVPPVASILTSSFLCILITVLSGMMPIFATVSDRPWEILQREQGSSSTRVVRLRGVLVALQIALCCALVIFATLLLQGFHDALKTGIGQKLGNPILVTVQTLPPPNIPEDYFKAVEESAKSIRHVAPIAWTSQLPGSQPIWQSFRIQGASLPLHELVLDVSEFTRDGQDQPEQQAIAGRLFAARDLSCRAAVVNGAAADALSGSATVGEQIIAPNGSPVKIIGVVQGVPAKPLSRLPTIYFDPLGPFANASRMGAHFRTPAALSPSTIELNVNLVSGNYMQALGLPLTAGHWFTDRAHFSDPCRHVGVMNQEAADLFFGGKPLGSKIIDETGSPVEIIGVVRSQDLGVFQQNAEPTVFIPAWQDYPLRMTLILKASKVSDEDMSDLQRKVTSVPGRNVALPDIETLDAQLSRSALAPLRIATLIALASALAAMIVSMIGVFSIQSDVHHERRKVLALHLAFGARGWRIMLKSLIESGQLVFVGCLGGVLCSVVLERLLLNGTGIITQPPVTAWMLALLLPSSAVVISGVIAVFRSLSVNPMTIMRER
jgi:ABC-type antimicrobial peptide transport system permease subunit